MSLIEFKDYPSTETPLNAENLNHNFNCLKGTVLYENESGSNGDITLSDSTANYSRIEIEAYGGIADVLHLYTSVRVSNPNGKRVNISVNQVYSGEYITEYIANYNINNNKLIYYVDRSFTVKHTVGGHEFEIGNLIYITKVVGYK